jgi:hypothetical protein
MSTKNPKSEKSENLETENPQNSDFGLSVELPEVTDTSTDYHDDEFLQTSENDAEASDTESPEAGALSDSDESSQSPDSGTQYTAEDDREKWRGVEDDKGKPYDPSQHIYPPEKTATGRWKKIPKSQRVKNDEGKEVLPTHSNITCRRDAEKAARFYDTIHCVIFGKDGKATKEQETALTDSFEKYFQENGALDLPPSVELGMTCLDHTTEIIKRPSIFERVQMWGVKLYLKFKGVKLEKVAEQNKDENQGE